ncbi:MAG: hypothetical protein JXA57_04975 [Armatimonadetes bacterium]|nr:hypothetical protein [Armatimonadota bacterium]
MSSRLTAIQSSQSAILNKAGLFTNFQLWPTRDKMDPQGWLGNFTSEELPYALVLLDGFLFYSEPLVEALFLSAVQAISAEVTERATSLTHAQALWSSFLARLRVTLVEGENPNPTDSGHLFVRMARQVLGIDQTQIVNPGEALSTVRRDPTLVVLFVDDFVGSGNQMESTWTRRYASNGSGEASFAQLAGSGSGTFYYVPVVATTTGMTMLKAACASLRVRPAHTLDKAYSLTHPDCFLWPDSLRPTARDALYEMSRRAGITGNCEYGWEGFHSLALPLGFWHCVPDATLPLFFWDLGSWAPLLRRT